MNRRDFIKAALAGLFVRFMARRMASAILTAEIAGDAREGVEVVGLLRSTAEDVGAPPQSRALNRADAEPFIEWETIDGVEQETLFGYPIVYVDNLEDHLRTESLCGDLYATDELLEDWIAMGWKPNG